MSARRSRAHFNPLIEALFALPIPVVAAVNGPCAGAGCSLALAADIVIAARSAYFLQAFVNIGLDPRCRRDLAAAAPRRPRAGDGDDDARRAHLRRAGAGWGMIARVVEDEDLAREAVALATRLAQGPTVASA